MKIFRLSSGFALLLQTGLVLLAAGVLTFLLWEPHLEGRNAQATWLEIYFKDPFLAYVYLGAVPFFVALYRAFGLVDQSRRDGGFSSASVPPLHAIKRCALILLGFLAGGVVFIFAFGDPDDRPAGFFMSALIAAPTSIVAIAAARFSRKLEADPAAPGMR